MIRGDKFIISKQIGNILLSRPDSSIAEVKSFVDGNVLFKIGKTQYILPVDTFSEYIIEKITPDKPREIRTVAAVVERAPLVITEPDVTDKDATPDPNEDSSAEPDNTTVTPPDPDKDLYDNDQYI